MTVHCASRRGEDVSPRTGSRQFADQVLGRRACSGIICLLKGNEVGDSSSSRSRCSHLDFLWNDPFQVIQHDKTRLPHPRVLHPTLDQLLGARHGSLGCLAIDVDRLQRELAIGFERARDVLRDGRLARARGTAEQERFFVFEASAETIAG